MITNYKNDIKQIILCPPSLAGIRTRDPDHAQNVNTMLETARLWTHSIHYIVWQTNVTDASKMSYSPAPPSCHCYHSIVPQAWYWPSLMTSSLCRQQIITSKPVPMRQPLEKSRFIDGYCFTFTLTSTRAIGVQGPLLHSLHFFLFNFKGNKFAIFLLTIVTQKPNHVLQPQTNERDWDWIWFFGLIDLGRYHMAICIRTFEALRF